MSAPRQRTDSTGSRTNASITVNASPTSEDVESYVTVRCLRGRFGGVVSWGHPRNSAHSGRMASKYILLLRQPFHAQTNADEHHHAMNAYHTNDSKCQQPCSPAVAFGRRRFQFSMENVQRRENPQARLVKGKRRGEQARSYESLENVDDCLWDCTFNDDWRSLRQTTATAVCKQNKSAFRAHLRAETAGTHSVSNQRFVRLNGACARRQHWQQQSRTVMTCLATRVHFSVDCRYSTTRRYVARSSCMLGT